jgi:hypothetical protein
MTNCLICGAATASAFTARILRRYDAEFRYCEACGHLRARDPHWLAEAYSSALALSDTGLVMRNVAVARRLAAVLYGVFPEHGEGRYLDIAGGYGMLTRLMRDHGFDFYWADKYAPNLLARGFEYQRSAGPCRAVTAIEVMEHLEDPVDFVSGALEQTGAEAFVFTTELFAGAPPPPGEWWYYAFEAGQHISFFQGRTLEALGRRLGLKFASGGGLHVFSRRAIKPASLSLWARLSPFIAPVLARRQGLTMQDHEALIAAAPTVRD